MGPVRAAWGRGKVAWGGVGLSRVEYHGTDAQASLGRVGPVRAAWGRGKVAWGGVGLSRVEYHGTDAEASLTSGRRPSGVGGYRYIYICIHVYIYIHTHALLLRIHRTSGHTHRDTYLHARLGMYIHKYTCKHAYCMYACMSVFSYLSICIYMTICICTYLHTYMHT